MVLVSALAAAMGVSALSVAGGRDPDGQRMRARKVDYPSTHADRLAPPEDRADWCYFKVDKAGRVSVKVTFKKASATGKLTLVGATGQTLGSADVGQQTARLTHSAKPGVYYIRIQAGTKTAYTLVIE